ncbi:MAG: DNA adenine methylase [Bacteroides sp.]|nr:DNA adenine methylase [Bacteroides sp.]MCM1085947.1 DNA adenine methylase [Bacteroides sp.]
MEFKVDKTAKPFIKWVGGKTQLLEEVRRSLPVDFQRKRNITYVEPFVGGGAVLFWILQEYPGVRRAVINDVNTELICTYRIIKSDVQALISILEEIQSEYQALSIEERKEYFLHKRNIYNAKQLSDLETAALFIFLNKTCFNGLYRVNAKGKFNVPHGKYTNPKICDRVNLLAVSSLLQRVEILNGDYSETEKYAAPNTLFYFDPPYKPITETSSFTSYSASGFDDKEQIRLRDFCNKISQTGASFIASNSDPTGINPQNTFFDEIYNRFRIKRVYASRMINSNPDARGSVPELMISNIVNA